MFWVKLLIIGVFSFTALSIFTFHGIALYYAVINAIKRKY